MDRILGDALARGRRLALAALAAWAGLLHAGCVPVPVMHAPSVSGRVVDQVTGAPVPDAVVVVRYDARYDDLLPERDLVGHAETLSDAEGRFTAGPLNRPGLSLWPLIRVEARVVGVLAVGYRCADPVKVERGGPVEVGLAPAYDPDDRKDSCRPLAARRGEAPRYMLAWRGLHPKLPTPAQLESERQLERVLAARTAFGYGENCEGPIVDLALAPGGRRAAFLARRGDQGRVGVVRFGHAAGLEAARTVEIESGSDGHVLQQLTWTGPDELVLWEPSGSLSRRPTAPVFAGGGTPAVVVWKADAPPASRGEGGSHPALQPSRPLEPADLHDEGDALWMGRTFRASRALDAETGLPTDWLQIVTEDGDTREIAIPGEPCGARGRFGRPHYRITVDARTALDLRYVNGGCHAVAIDLESGEWNVVDGDDRPAVCRETRRMPASHLVVALRGYALEIDEALAAAEADPTAPYALQLAAGGHTVLLSRDHTGSPIRLVLPAFPVRTPLRRIDVSLVGGSTSSGQRAIPSLEPL
jgi:hypothetical protein